MKVSAEKKNDFTTNCFAFLSFIQLIIQSFFFLRNIPRFVFEKTVQGLIITSGLVESKEKII